jgi:uncharacterized protein (DUF1800 family)
MKIHLMAGRTDARPAVMMTDPLNAFRRFGFGRRGAEPVPEDVRKWLLSQLEAPDPLLSETGPSILNAVLVERRWDDARKAGLSPTYGQANIFGDEMTAALQHASTTDLSFRERLVWWWSNHFTASARAGGFNFGFAGSYIREAIRPHVTGHFTDMVKAVMRHPAMLIYLANDTSMGPNSPTGLKQRRGLNENLARECLELHTMGVYGGYTQQDVTSFAAVLTGRSMQFDGDTPGFVFKVDMHEPGPKTLIGHTFPEGFEGSEAALDFIATHPATHRHIATQLVQHFVADTPPEHCVARVAAELDRTQGDLKQAMAVIVDMPEAWQPLTKFRAPADYVVAVLRALDLPPLPETLNFAATQDLGQPFMDPLLPNGWPDTADDWLSGESLLKRADWAMTQASRPGAPTADSIVAATLGDLCSQFTRTAIKACPNPAEALATLFASPEFMRR